MFCLNKVGHLPPRQCYCREWDVHLLLGHTLYLSFLLHRQDFWKPNFTPKKTTKITKNTKNVSEKVIYMHFFHSFWKNLHLTENFYTDMSVVSVTNKRYESGIFLFFHCGSSWCPCMAVLIVAAFFLETLWVSLVLPPPLNYRCMFHQSLIFNNSPNS